jgi:hypothetical protein
MPKWVENIFPKQQFETRVYKKLVMIMGLAY